MDMESAQVSRLLELAAAMSSAQEKVTGNGKLDMAGIMAALSLAHQEDLSIKENSQARGQNSFLHGKYQVDSKSSLVRAEYIKETTLSEESESWESVDGEEKKKSFLYDKKTIKSVEKKENQSDTGEKGKYASNINQIQMMNKKPNDIKISSPKGDRVEGGSASLVENETNVKGNANESFLHNNGRREDLVLKDNETNLFGRKVAGYKAAFESMNSSSSASSSVSSSSSSSSNANSPTSLIKHGLHVKTESVKELNDASDKIESPAPHLASSQSIANFLTKHQSWKKAGSEEKEANNNNLGNIKEERITEKEKINGIGNKKVMFERSIDKDDQEDT